MPFQRASGILLHPTSFPGLHGIGDLGRSAYDFIDFMVSSGQSFWQILPLGPTGYEHSPYIMNFSTFAGNPLLISLEHLVDVGWLTPDEVHPLYPDGDPQPQRVNFDTVIPHKMGLLKQAYQRFQAVAPRNATYEEFQQQQGWWLDDYTLFMALLESFGGLPWNQWDAEYARREPAALERARSHLRDSINFQTFLQFTFFEQWKSLRAYANQRGIQIVGDISIYVCYNSSDVWANQSIFQLDPTTLEPTYIAGVPPDYFSATGQLWGNPVYDWDRLKDTRFDWWIKRFKATLEYANIVRIDHFRGFEAYWRVPAGETTAIRGEWVLAPGVEFFETIGSVLGHLPVMAEDLGIITPEVEALRDRFHFPGMRILQFAFGGGSDSVYLPHNYTSNSVVYPGTHDNDTAIGWWNSTGEAEKQHVAQYFGYSDPGSISEINWLLIRAALASVADLAIIPLQDILGLDSQGRMNDPSINAGNWRWRYDDSSLLTPDLSHRLLTLTRLYRR